MNQKPVKTPKNNAYNNEGVARLSKHRAKAYFDFNFTMTLSSKNRWHTFWLCNGNVCAKLTLWPVIRCQANMTQIQLNEMVW